MSDASLLDEVRETAAWVAARARQVRIRAERLPSYAQELAGEIDFEPGLDPRYHYLGRGEETAAFVLCLDAVNFGSGWFRWLVDPPGLAGYFTIADALRERFERQGVPSAEELAAIDVEECRRIFGQTEAAPPIDELMGHYSRSLRQLGLFVLERCEGRFGALVEAVGGSAERLVQTLIQMPAFDDVASYAGRRVVFFKRAQLTAVDLSLAFSGVGPGRFHDLERLTVFADNQLPQVLRADGVLEYSTELGECIDHGVELGAGSPQEVEIRAATVHAVELLVAELAARGTRRAAWELDQLLWHRGLGRDYNSRPAHRTRTIFY